MLSLLLTASLAVASVLPGNVVSNGLVVASQPILKRDPGGGTCSSPDFVNATLVGAPGTIVCESDWGKGYLPITNLTVWYSTSAITGIQATYSDGTVGKLLGSNAGTKQTYLGINYGQGDKFTQATLYGHTGAPGTYLRRIELKTIKGGSLNAGAAPSSSLKRDQPVGIGVLFALGATIDSKGKLAGLEFLFLQPAITEIEITDIQFPNGPVGSSDNIFPRSIGKAHFYNNASQPQTYSFNNQVSMTQSYTFMQAFALSFGGMQQIAFEFDLKPLGIGGTFTTTTTFTWNFEETTTISLMHSDMQQVQYNLQVTLNPGQGVDCLAIVGQGAGTFFYTSQVTLSLKNGHSYTFPENGYVTVQAISAGSASCSDANHP